MKLFMYIFIMVGIMVMIVAAGYSPPVGGFVRSLVISAPFSGDADNLTTTDLDKFTVQDIKNSNFWTLFIAALATITVGTIVAGLFTSIPSVNHLLAGVLSFFVSLFMIDLVWVYQKLLEHGNVWIVFAVTAIFAPLIIGFILAAMEWWAGHD